MKIMPLRFSVPPFLKSYCILFLAPVLLLSPLLIHGQVLFWGTPSLQFIPWWVQAWASLRQGNLPLWNPLNGMGAPLLANEQLAFFYPPNWFLLGFAALGGAPGVAWGYLLLTILHLIWAGLGMALFLRQLNFRWLGQIVGGLGFGLSGFIVARLQFFSIVWAAAWLPWIMLYAARISSPVPLRTTGERRNIFLPGGLAVCLAMQFLAGHAQLAWYTLLFAATWVSAGILCHRSVRALFESWARLAVSSAWAVGLSAIQFIPTFEYLRQSQRASAYAYEEAVTYSFFPWRLLTLFSPNLFGSPADGNFWGYASYWEDHAYAGVLPILLALATLWLLIRGFRRSHRSGDWTLMVYAWVMIVVAVFLALGKFFPLFPFLYRNIPTFSMFQAPARYMIWFAFLMPVLAAVAVEHWRSPTGRGLYWFRLGTAGAFAVALGAGLAWFLMKKIEITFIQSFALTGFWAVGFGLLTLAIPFVEKKGWIAAWQWVVIGWTLADLLLLGWSLNPGVPASFYAGDSSTHQVPHLAQGGRVYIGHRDEYALKFKRFLRFSDYSPLENWENMRATLLPNLNLLSGIPSANNFDPLVPGRFARWMAELDTLSPDTKARWLAFMGVGAVEHIDASQPGGVRWDPVAESRRSRWFSCAIPAGDSEEAWRQVERRIDDPTFPLQTLLVEGLTPGQAAGPCTSSFDAGSPRILSERQDEIWLEVNAPVDGWLLLADMYYPGWQASVDEKAVKIYPANTIFRVIPVPAGSHQVRFLYQPLGFYFGILFSILVLLSAAVVSLQWGAQQKKTVRL